VWRPGETLVRLATAGGVEVVTEKPRPHDKLIAYPHPVQPFWYNQAGTSACGTAVAWSTGLLGGKDSPLSFRELDSLAEQVPPGAEGLVFHPYLAGERCPHWDPELRGSFVGLGLSHTQAHLARAVLEGVSLSIRDALSVLPGESESGSILKVVGGGARSAVWLRILAAVLNRSVAATPDAESSYGAAVIAHAATKGTPLESSLKKTDLSNSRLVPDPAWVDRYERAFSRYRLVHRQLREVYHAPSEQGSS
jgi:xylulokinase